MGAFGQAEAAPDGGPLGRRVARYWLGYVVWTVGAGSVLGKLFFEMYEGHTRSFDIVGREVSWLVGMITVGSLGALMFPVALGLIHSLVRMVVRQSFDTLALNMGRARLAMAVLSLAFAVLVRLDYIQETRALLFVPLLVYPLYVWILARTAPIPMDLTRGRRLAVLLAGI